MRHRPFLPVLAELKCETSGIHCDIHNHNTHGSIGIPIRLGNDADRFL